MCARLTLAVGWLIDLMRCVPFMLFCYLIYYALPSFGIVIDNLAAGISALTLYNAAYIAELLRGGYAALPRDGIEAGHAFGFHGWRLLVRIMLPPVLLSSAPDAGQPDGADHQGQCVSRDYRRSGTDFRRQRNPGNLLCAVRELCLRDAAILGVMSGGRGRRAGDY